MYYKRLHTRTCVTGGAGGSHRHEWRSYLAGTRLQRWDKERLGILHYEKLTGHAASRSSSKQQQQQHLALLLLSKRTFMLEWEHWGAAALNAARSDGRRIHPCSTALLTECNNQHPVGCGDKVGVNCSVCMSELMTTCVAREVNPGPVWGALTQVLPQRGSSPAGCDVWAWIIWWRRYNLLSVGPSALGANPIQVFIRR